MGVLHRYLFRQLLAATAMAVGLFVFVLVAGVVIREALDPLASGRLPWGTFCYLVALAIPGVLPYALPLGLLTAVLLVVGRLCAQQEYTAMRAAGLSLWVVGAPVLVLAGLGVALLLFINFFYAPAADDRARAAALNVLRRDPLSIFQPHTFIHDFPNYVFYVGSRDGDEFRDVWAWQLDAQGRATHLARGRSGQVTYDPARDALIVTLDNATVQRQDAGDPEDFRDPNQFTLTFRQTDPVVLKLDALIQTPANRKKLSLMTLPELLDARANGPPIPDPTADQLAVWRSRVRMQIQRDGAGAFAVLAFALLGLPLGLKTGRAETFANLGLALALALGYYFLLFCVSMLEDHPALRPDLLLWAPNFLCDAAGLVLLRRAARR